MVGIYDIDVMCIGRIQMRWAIPIYRDRPYRCVSKNTFPHPSLLISDHRNTRSRLRLDDKVAF
jgi:hypothetical protein